MDNNFHRETEEHLRTVDILELTKSIHEFHNLNFRNISDTEFFEAIHKVLLWNGEFHYFPKNVEYPIHTPFYRVRKLNSSVISNCNFQKYSDLWEAPADKLTEYGRLNKPHEPLLYVSLEADVAIKETRIKDDDFFALIKYTSKDKIKANFIGGEYNYHSLGITDKHAITVNEIYNNFLQDEFSRDVGNGTEYLYKISEMIAKTFFDLPPRVIQDAWAYCSVQDKSKYNLCFRPEIAHDLLEVHGALICKKDSSDFLHPACIAICVNGEDLSFYEMNPLIQKAVFPELIQYS